MNLDVNAVLDALVQPFAVIAFFAIAIGVVRDLLQEATGGNDVDD